jgi:Fe-S cluster assembly protein SufB
MLDILPTEQSNMQKGLNASVVTQISQSKNEPKWVLDQRLKALKIFNDKSLPLWGPDLSSRNFDDIYYHAGITNKKARFWADVPQDIKTTFEKLGVPEYERKYLAGVEAQFDSEMIYGNLLNELGEKGVIFTSIEEGLKKHPDLFKKYYGNLVSPDDHKFAALNGAVWSGGSFMYIPENVVLEKPLQAYFRINTRNLGQFERTLIIIGDGAQATYIEGCTAPLYAEDSLHAAAVEVFVGRGAKLKYVTIQNWSENVLNLSTKKAQVDECGFVSWLDINLGSRITMKYPACVLKGVDASAEMYSISYSKGVENFQDVGAKMIHLANNTTSRVISKSISLNGGTNTYRGLVSIDKNCNNAKSYVACDALILDDKSSAKSFPVMRNGNKSSQIEHEATVSKVDEQKLFYLMSRGFSEIEARSLLIAGFIEPVAKDLPMEYLVELNRLIEIDVEEYFK